MKDIRKEIENVDKQIEFEKENLDYIIKEISKTANRIPVDGYSLLRNLEENIERAKYYKFN